MSMTEDANPPARVPVVVQDIRIEAEGVLSFHLVDPEGRDLPAFTAGAHVDVEMPGGLTRQYSLCNDPGERNRYVIAVLREADGRGGSAWMHTAVRRGDRLMIGAPRNNFPLVETARSHILIAGGIGVTPMLAMARRLRTIGADWRLHYCSRRVETTAFHAELSAPPFQDAVTFHHDGGDPRNGIDLEAALRDAAPGTHLYCCGPASLMAAVRAAAAAFPADAVHFEAFKAEPPPAGTADRPFSVRLARRGITLTVPENRSTLSVLRENGVDVPTSCEEGVCGTCAVTVLDGEVDHRDQVLSDAERSTGRLMLVCVSRARGGAVALDL